MSAQNGQGAGFQRLKTIVGDSLGLVLVVWAIPVAIIVVGAPIVLVVALLIKLTS